MMIKVGIDVGGTHTDLMTISTEGRIVAVDKARTTKEDITKAVIALIQNSFENQVDQISLVVNGTTVGTNAILERAIPQIALLTTRGFRDVLLMRRETKAELTNLQWDKPSPLVRRSNIFEVEERIDYDGSVYRELSRESLSQAVSIIKSRNITNIAVVFLHSYANPVHEKLAQDIIVEYIPGAEVTISYDILPEWREFERTYNTVLAAALKPVLLKYFVDLGDRLKSIGFKGNIEIMQANAGVASVENIQANPISTLYSGVAGGVVGGLMNSDPKRDKGNIITFDMGGTSTDICLVNGGDYTVTTEQQLEWEGYLKFPCIDIHSIGAGGGSIAWIDEADCMHVGPQSAGAVPGPACYDTGGEKPAVTDANLLLGYLNPNNYLGGRYSLSAERARKAIESLSRKLGLSAIECAYGIRAIVDANMVNGIRHVSVERGHDPREFALVAFGGAGPMHAAGLMQQLGMTKAIIPLYPGNVSAAGLLGARPRIDLMRTMYSKLDDADLDMLETQYVALEEEILRRTKVWDVNKSDLEIARSMDMRYTGQTHELIIDRIPADLSGTSRKEIASLFHSRHNDLYSYYNEYEPIAIVNVRVAVLGPQRAVGLWAKQTDGGSDRPPERRVAVFKSGGNIEEIEAAVLRRTTLSRGFSCDGPAIIEEDLSTTLIPPGFRVEVLEQGVLEICEKA